MSRIRLVFAAAVLAGAAVAGCGGGDGGQPAAKPSQNANDQLLEYTRCMRSHGVAMPDPADEDAPLPKPDGNPSVAAADRQCRRHLPPKMQGGGDATAHDQLVELARCLRGQGVRVPDPQPGQRLSLPPGSAGDQRVQDAVARCGKVKPGSAEPR